LLETGYHKLFSSIQLWDVNFIKVQLLHINRIHALSILSSHLFQFPYIIFKTNLIMYWTEIYKSSALIWKCTVFLLNISKNLSYWIKTLKKILSEFKLITISPYVKLLWLIPFSCLSFLLVVYKHLLKLYLLKSHLLFQVHKENLL
jgi:hypothetical protein